MATTQVKIRGKTVKVPDGTKSDIARALLDEGYTVSEISKAVPMAYSQAHSIAQKMGSPAKAPKARPGWTADALKSKSSRPKYKAVHVTMEDMAKASVPTKREKDRVAKQADRRVAAAINGTPDPKRGKPKIGKLRTPGHPSDIGVGECANCGHDLAIRQTPVGLAIIHVNTTAEEYLATTQFCTAVPAFLLR